MDSRMTAPRVWSLRILIFVLLSLSSIQLSALDETTVDRLNKTINDVISKREYQWRLPRQKSDRELQTGILSRFFEKFLDYFTRFVNWAREIWTKLNDWWRRLFPEPNPMSETQSPSTAQWPMLRILIVMAAAVLVLFVWRLIRNRRRLKRITIHAQPAVAQPDLNDENLLADSLPESNWQTLANELLRKGEYRLALRAQYMAVLASLGEKEFIRIAKYKSNKEYERELERRTRERRELIQTFSESVDLFERSWYGRDAVTEETFEIFSNKHDRIKQFTTHEAV
jgi:hypothetical protein